MDLTLNAPVLSRVPRADRFRCEGCGYVLSGSIASDVCQECARPVASSRPGARDGTPWQQRRSITSWIRTAVGVVVSPTRSFLRLRMQLDEARRTFFLNLILATAFCFVPMLTTLTLGPRHVQVAATPIFGTVTQYDPVHGFLVVMVPILCGLSIIAVYLAAHYIGPRKHPPVWPAVIWANASLSSFAIVVATTASVALWALRYLLTPTEPIPFDLVKLWVLLLVMAAPILAFLLILIWTGVVDLIGQRANRFANEWTDSNEQAP